MNIIAYEKEICGESVQGIALLPNLCIYFFLKLLHIPGENHNSKRYRHPNVHCSTITIARTWKQHKCPSTEEWIKKMRYIYTMEYSSDIKKNEIMPFAATWMDLEIVILSEVSQTQKDEYHMISLICGI